MVKEVYAYLESHWDREWYKTFEEYHIRLCEVLEDIFEKIENNEINSFYLDGQVIALKDYLTIHSEKSEYVKNLIKSKKLFIGPFYDLADEFLVCGESLLRNLQIGRNEAIKFNADENDFVGYLPDAFGHTKIMPMLFNKANIKNALVWRGINIDNQEFYWTSDDNSKVKTAFLAGGYYQDFFAQKSYKKNLMKLLKRLEKYCDKDTPILLPVGADHLACEDNIRAKIKNFNRNNKDFKIKLSSLKEYFEKTKNNTNLKTIKSELNDNSNSCLLYGTHSARIYLKQMNMFSQWRLGKISEPLFAILKLYNLTNSKQDNFDYAWKLLIENHAHDSICGCCVDEVHQENIIRYKKVNQITSSLIDKAKFVLEKKFSKNQLGIMNLSNFDFSGVVSFYSTKKLPLICVGKKKMFPISISQDIHNIPIQENYNYNYEYLIDIDNVAGIGFKLISNNKQAKSNMQINNNHIENEKLIIDINKNGTFNIKNKITNKVFNNLFKISDEADVGDSYTFSCILDDEKIFAEFLNSKIIEDNDLRKILRLNYKLNIPSHAVNDKKRSKKLLKHIFNVELILTKNSERLDIKINYENFSKDHILKINFELPNKINEVISEDAFGTVKRNYEPNYNYKKELPIPEFTELNINTGVFQRFVIAQGLTIITKGLQEYEVQNNNLNLTLLRCFGILSKRRLSTRAFAAGPPLPTEEGQCLTKQTAEISLVLSDDINNAFKQSDFFYNSVVAFDGQGKSTQLKDFEFLNLPDNFYIYNIKEADDKHGIIIKIFNNSDKKETFIFNNEFDIFETDLFEKVLNNKNLKNKKIEFKQRELKIFKLGQINH